MKRSNLFILSAYAFIWTKSVKFGRQNPLRYTEKPIKIFNPNASRAKGPQLQYLQSGLDRHWDENEKVTKAL